ncbi:hypothetical protein K3495_g5391 [Podosphaera aphanis]|nr:hypothetical protein K3495_g5391 [Podosphaera aphanis]
MVPALERASNPTNTLQRATNPTASDGTREPDTCRICRGEGDPSESLFHPCKCSGSIKYVHQDCLMEWLSHSQKKHCELCKTAFRFTKLYSPNMPQSLPFHVLIRHVVIHAAKNMATWIRFCLVFIVWLGLLPYTIRQVWRFLFWFSDGAWPSIHNAGSSNTTEAIEMAHEVGLATLLDNGTTSALPFRENPISPASSGTIVDRLLGLLMPVSHALNISGSDDIATSLFKSIYYGLRFQSTLTLEQLANTRSPSNYQTDVTSTPRNPSLLSDISFLQNLTKSSSLNQLIINIAEGHIITMLVLICFILIFLIREWVVQQQPGIDMGAAFNAEFAAPERPRNIPQQPPALLADTEVEEGHLIEPIPHPASPTTTGNQDLELSNEIIDNEIGDTRRPAAAKYDMKLESRISEQQLMAEYFLEIWRNADGNFDEVMSTIRADGRIEELRFWVDAMKNLENPTKTERHNQQFPTSDLILPLGDRTFSQILSHDSTGNRKLHTAEASNSSTSTSSTGSWADALGSQSLGEEIKFLHKDLNRDIKITEIPKEIANYKGKSRAQDYQETSRTQRRFLGLGRSESSETSNHETVSRPPIPRKPNSQAEKGSRPRSISDSPQLKGPSPLSTNNWSFPKVQSELDGDIIYALALKASNKTSGDTDKVVCFEENFGFSDFKNRISGVPSASKESNGQNIENLEQEIFQSEKRANLQISDSVESFKEVDSDTDLKEQNSDNEDFSSNPSLSNNSAAEAIVETIPQPEIPSPETRNPVVVRPAPPTLLGKIADFFWGGVGEERHLEDLAVNDGQAIHDFVARARFIPAAGQDALLDENALENQAAQVAADPGIDPNDFNDADAIEDAEDFEGIMELVGMRGPIFSLVQNALFSSFLLGLTIAIGVWAPYNMGRITLLLLANPGSTLKLPLRILFGCAAFMQDMALSIIGFSSLLLIRVVTLLCRLSSSYFSLDSSRIASHSVILTSTATNISSAAFQRIKEDAISNIIHITDSDMSVFSAACHQSLITIQNIFIDSSKFMGLSAVYIFTGNYNLTWANAVTVCKVLLHTGIENIKLLPSLLANPDLWMIGPYGERQTTPIDLELSVWNGTDRFFAILVGYTMLCTLGALYVRRGSPFSTGQVGRELEAAIVDLLNQAGGVLKVILIISIEMLAFPLYCGLLLDVALLPLFENTTILSRIVFTVKSPLTSIFVHWFVGTCYMFHFALFVSMCRKIMRKGVLYFIRDPDDPTFHPVRDVLERNVTTQLQKILFSAIVYGGLVIICLGGVVWGISFTFKDVLPLHWSSNEPVLEFPIDLLFYNFLMPLAVRFFKPSHGLRTLYDWWFRRCARMLRLTWFMFDERRKDEEGHLVRRTWKDFFCGSKGDALSMVHTDDQENIFEKNPQWNAYYRRDGRYVRAPASDQVRIPRGTSIFLEVDEMNNRLDGKPDENDGIHGRDSILSKQVYIPPWFRLRIFVFIISIWFFAAVTGVGVTIVPLVFGRIVFAKMIPMYVRENDIYAFSVGIYILGSALYCVLHLKNTIVSIRNALVGGTDPLEKAIRCVSFISSRLLRITWTYTAFLLVLPTLFTFLVEFYFIIPLHTYFAMGERHVVHFVQSWTLGLLYVKLTTRLILWYENSRPAQSLRAITRNGYLNPDARLATRSFILPCAIILSVALFSPFILAQLTIKALLQQNPEKHMLVYRYSYPICLCLCCIAVVAWVLMSWAKNWRLKIRDEVYLIGEQLHNFGDRKVASNLRPIET